MTTALGFKLESAAPCSLESCRQTDAHTHQGTKQADVSKTHMRKWLGAFPKDQDCLASFILPSLVTESPRIDTKEKKMERNEVVEERCPPRDLDVKSRKQHWREEGSKGDERKEQKRGRFRCGKTLKPQSWTKLLWNLAQCSYKWRFSQSVDSIMVK